MTKKILIIFTFFFLFFITISMLLLNESNEETQITLNKFKNSSPRLIATFTGEKGRIEFAKKLMNQYKDTSLFISGVYYGTKSIESIVKKNREENIYIDSSALDTKENIDSLYKFVSNKNIDRDIIIVSHDYHIRRIKWYIQTKKEENNNDYKFYYIGIESDYQSFRKIKILSEETFKMIYLFISRVFRPLLQK